MNIFIVKLWCKHKLNWCIEWALKLSCTGWFNQRIRPKLLANENSKKNNNYKKALSHPSTPCHFCAPLLGKSHTSGYQKFHFVLQGLEARNNNHNRCNLKPSKMCHKAFSGSYGETYSFHSNVPVTSLLPDCPLKPSFMWFHLAVNHLTRQWKLKWKRKFVGWQ